MHYRAKIERILLRICRDDVAKRRTKGFEFIDHRTHKNAYESLWRIPNGYSYLDVEKQVDALCAACGAIIELVNKAGGIIIRVIPNDLPNMIPFKPEMIRGLNQLELLIGYNRRGDRVTHSLKTDNPHILIASETGWGKTEIIRLLVLTLISQFTPDELEIYIADLKGFSFLPFRSVPHIKEIARNVGAAEALLSRSAAEVEQRGIEVWDSGDRENIRHFKKRVVIIDEAASLSPTQYGKQDPNRDLAKLCDMHMTQIARIGREAGIHLIYATQYPTSEVMNRQVKMNCGGRICYHVASQVNSMVVLDSPGAELLKHKGRAIYKSGEMQIVQTPYLRKKSEEDETNDNAWRDLLIPYKTEVVNSGQSAKRKHSKVIVDVPGGEVLPGSPAIQQSKPEQTSVRTLEVAPVRKAYRKQPTPINGKSMAVNPQGEDDDGDEYDVTF